MKRNNEEYPGLSTRQNNGYPYNNQMSSSQSMRNTIKQKEIDNIKSLPPVITNPGYLQGYLRTKIGEFMKVNFLLGTGTFIDKEGILEEVGVDHIVLKNVNTGDDTVADLYSIKFIDIPNQ